MMSDAPEKIWAFHDDLPQLSSGAWADCPLSYGTEYVRADLADAEIAALRAEVERLRPDTSRADTPAIRPIDGSSWIIRSEGIWKNCVFDSKEAAEFALEDGTEDDLIKLWVKEPGRVEFPITHDELWRCYDLRNREPKEPIE